MSSVQIQLYDAATGAFRMATASDFGSPAASDGAALNIDSLAQTLAWNADGTINYVQVVSGGNTYRQTYTYTSGQVTGISAWVKQ